MQIGMADCVHAASCPAGGDHDYDVQLIRQASEDTDGLRRYTCTKCGDSYDEVIPKSGHHWSSWKTVQSPTCTAQGIEQRECSKCGKIEQKIIEPRGHSYELAEEYGPSCTEPGLRLYVCTTCGARYEERYGEPLGHDWGEWQVSEDSGDIEQRICKRDSSHKETRAIAITSVDKSQGKTHTATETEPQDLAGWNIYNTAVAGFGAIAIAAAGAQAVSYLIPLMWIKRRRREKRRELYRRLS